MKTGSKIEEEINSSTKRRADVSQASCNPHGSNCCALAAVHAAFFLLGLSLGMSGARLLQEGMEGRCYKSVRNHASLLFLTDTLVQPEVQTKGQSSLALI